MDSDTVLDAVYAERDMVLALAAKLAILARVPVWIREHEPAEDETEWDPAWRFVVFMQLPAGQVSWHIHERELGWFRDVPSLPYRWDGHDTPEKYRRVLEDPAHFIGSSAAVGRLAADMSAARERRR